MSAPRVVAVVGASTDRRKFGNKALRAFRRHGDHAIPINPNATTVEGLQAYASILDVPGRVDVATVYVRPEVGERVIEEIARKGVREVWLNPGADAPGVLDRARALGIEPVVACSIIGIGESPGGF